MYESVEQEKRSRPVDRSIGKGTCRKAFRDRKGQMWGRGTPGRRETGRGRGVGVYPARRGTSVLGVHGWFRGDSALPEPVVGSAAVARGGGRDTGVP